MLTNVSYAQAAEQPQPFAQKTPAYPNPVVNESDDAQLKTVLAPYPAPLTFIYPAPVSPPVDLSNLTYHVNLPVVMSRTYNRQAAVDYADQWAHARNSAFPNFGSGEGCNDCTNYLSQMLLAGGHTQIVRYNNTVFDWWYYCDEFGVCSNSNTWSATDWMNSYATQYSDKFEKVNTGITSLSEGDFFIMDLATSPHHGIPNHARLVVGWGYPEEGDNMNTWNLLVNQHCTDRKRVRWNYNLPSDTPVWVWHVLH